MFYLYCNYPGLATPKSVEQLRRRLSAPDDELVRLLNYDRRPPSQNTLLKWFRKIDEHPDLVEQALVAISDRLPWVLPSEEDPKDEKAKQPSKRTAKVNRYIKGREEEALGDQEFRALFQQDIGPAQSNEDDASERLFLEWAHNNNRQCHKCKPGDCTKRHSHGVLLQPRTQKGRRRWRCPCCRSYLSVTSGTLLHSLKMPPKTVLKCLYYMIRSRRGISAMQMAGFFNVAGKNMPIARILKLMHRIRAAMAEDPPVFEGTTEIDEAVIILSDGTQAHLIGAYNHGTGRVHIETLERKATKPVMRDFINRVTAPGSRIYVDGDAAVPREGPDRDTTRKYHWLNHTTFEWGRCVSLGEDDPRGLWATTNHIEGTWGFLKRSMRLRVSVSRHHLHLYLAEVIWRANYLSNRVEAEVYEGHERRELALMRQVVSRMVGTRITEKALRGPLVMPAKEKARQLPLSPQGRAFRKPEMAVVARATAAGGSDRLPGAKPQPQFQIEMELVWYPKDITGSIDPATEDVTTPEHRLRFGVQPELPLDYEILDESKRQEAA